MKRSVKAFSVLLMSCALVGGFGTVGASAHTLSRHTPAINVVQPMPAQPGAPVVPAPVVPAPVAPAPVAPAPVAPAPVAPAPVAPAPVAPAQPGQTTCPDGALVTTEYDSDCYAVGDSHFVVDVQQIVNNTTVPVLFYDTDQDQLITIAAGQTQTFNGDAGKLMIP